MDELRSPSGHVTYPLPEEGIYDENGFLFHHGHPRPILDIHRKRLAQHGITLERKKNYSKQEVETLERNWNAYRKKYGFSYWSIHKLCGKGFTRSESRSKNGQGEKIRDFLHETNFWQRFCAGIQNRTSHHIKSRINFLFDIYQGLNVAQEEKPFCEKLYISTRSLLTVASIMKRSLRSVQTCIELATRRKKFSRSERRWLWMMVKSAYPKLIEDDNFPDATRIDWKSMESRLLRNAGTLEQQWDEMIEEMKTEIKAGHTLEEALDLVAPKCERVSPLQVAHFINLVKDKIVSDDDHRIGRAEAYIAPLMQEQGLTGFHSKRLSEFEYLRQLANGIILKCRKRILNPCRIFLTLKNLLWLIFEILRTLPNSDTPRAIRITTKHFFRTMIRMQREHDSTWKPRNKKLRKVISELLPDII